MKPGSLLFPIILASLLLSSCIPSWAAHSAMHRNGGYNYSPRTVFVHRRRYFPPVHPYHPRAFRSQQVRPGHGGEYHPPAGHAYGHAYGQEHRGPHRGPGGWHH